MRRCSAILLLTVVSAIVSGCISKDDLCGNWYCPQGYGDSRVIFTDNYAVTFGAPGKHDEKNFVGKWHYDVKNYGLFLRVKCSTGFTDHVFNIFGFKLRDQSNYWLGFIPVLGFQYSYKISDEEMLRFLRKYKFSAKDVMDKPIMMRQYNTTEFVVDSSFPTLMQKLQEQQPGCDD